MTITLTPRQHLDAVHREAARLVDAVANTPLTTTVPSCPDWDVAELLRHMGRVYRWAAACVEAGDLVSPSELGDPPERTRAALADWVRGGADTVVRVLDRPPDEPTWTWSPDGTVGFWQRRQCQETVIHRVDAELAAGALTPVPSDLAVDGIDEWLALLSHRPGVPPVRGGGDTLHLHCTDVEGEWLIQVDADRFEVTTGHAKGDVAVRGPASDVLLVLLRRGTPDTVDILGERAVLDGFLAQTGF